MHDLKSYRVLDETIEMKHSNKLSKFDTIRHRDCLLCRVNHVDKYHFMSTFDTAEC